MSRLVFLFILWILPFPMFSQSLEITVDEITAHLAELDQQRADLLARMETVKLQMVRRDLELVGLPSSDYILHQAMALSYSEKHEQAAWVAHIIRPEIIDGTVFRSNDFRPDSLVKTGTAVEQDYFLKTLQADSTYVYDGFGYDRGHLAPSADFRWSATALSESYFYSNMSPQRPAFNRESWAALEGLLRGYIYRHPDTQLYVVTGPVLHDALPVIERSINKVAIPEQYFKVVLDQKAQQAIAFLMPNTKTANPLSFYAMSVDEVEALTGFDFFHHLDNEDTIEASLDKEHWIPEIAAGDVEPLYPPSLPRGHFNTIQAKRYMGKRKTISVCGTIVSSRYSRSGNLWFNLDQRFPNQIFSVFIKKEDLINFSTDVQKAYEGKTIVVRGEVRDFNGVPTINLKREERIQEFVQ
ncbi:MAG: DNA/RNA non-specific endonuclease [Bacteroidota bacterium]